MSMKRFVRPFSVFVVITFLGSCATAPERNSRNGKTSSNSKPGWYTEGTHPEYPSEMYVTGIGSGQSRKQAFASALSEIALQVRTEIDVSFETRASETIKSSGEREKVEHERESVQDIQLQSTFESEGLAKMVDVYIESDSRVHHAFVALPKQDARQHFSREFSEQMETAKSTIEELKKARSSADIRRIAELYNQFVDVHRKLHQLKGTLGVFDGRVSKQQQSRLEEMAQIARESVSKIRKQSAVRLCVTSDSRASSFTSQIRDWFASRGVSTYGCKESVPAGTDYRIRLKSDISLSCSPADEIKSLTMCRGGGSVELLDKNRSQPILETSIGGEESREGNRQKEEALRQVQKNLSGELTSKLASVFGK